MSEPIVPVGTHITEKGQLHGTSSDVAPCRTETNPTLRHALVRSLSFAVYRREVDCGGKRSSNAVETLFVLS